MLTAACEYETTVSYNDTHLYKLCSGVFKHVLKIITLLRLLFRGDHTEMQHTFVDAPPFFPNVRL